MRPEDDYTHPVGTEPTFNESMYVHFNDPTVGMAGFVRMANRPNEGRGEVTVCLYLPDGGVAFRYVRPEGTSNERFAAAGMELTVREPMHHLDVDYTGQVSLVADPSAMDDPRAALGRAPSADCLLRLDVRAVAPEYDHSFDTDEGSFAPNHYEQFVTVTGRIVLDGRETMVRGFGLRDHSWGPRSWQAPWFYRWVHGCGEGVGFMGAYFGSPGGTALTGGVVWDGKNSHALDDVVITTERDARDEQTAISVVLSSGARQWKVRGRAAVTVPLRNRRAGDDGDFAVTRIAESLMSWTLDDGRTINGMAEYLDQMRDGRPVGLSV
ncbi:hypothetical protein AD006_29330 (plasmid) [Pseudonocardia sp. EC080610-09]|uniref:DUF7065 domain-containing protein n=1 Tax=unclassified Pseudonocardia TaxID=2619320 RepID=UPI0007057A6C|nr:MULTISPECIES: hypothetical protein [unclassified Pseudonocardia]ALL79385.1 hypothetical protein AD006_29330 [Pseudonocardia sp. EC080610-09]ALL85662.1 hypothetical protein AD017_31925 [Pseudonocardia sp. EC080619-01]